MPLTEEQITYAKREIERLPHSNLRFLGNVLVIALHDARGNRKPEPQDVIDRLISPDTYLEFDPTGPADSKWTAVFGLRTTIKLDWAPLNELYFENPPNSHRGEVTNTLSSTDVFIYVYEDTDRESFETIATVNSKINYHLSTPQAVEAPKVEAPQGLLKRVGSGIGRRLSLKRRGSTRRERSGSHSTKLATHQEAPIPEASVPRVPAPIPEVPGRRPAPPGDVSLIPKFVVANCRTKGEVAVTREEGESLAQALGAEFHVISTDRLKWGDRDVLQLVGQRLMFQRVSGKPASKEWPDRNC